MNLNTKCSNQRSNKHLNAQIKTAQQQNFNEVAQADDKVCFYYTKMGIFFMYLFLNEESEAVQISRGSAFHNLGPA